jgi:hypothetical protein
LASAPTNIQQADAGVTKPLGQSVNVEVSFIDLAQEILESSHLVFKRGDLSLDRLRLVLGRRVVLISRR